MGFTVTFIYIGKLKKWITPESRVSQVVIQRNVSNCTQYTKIRVEMCKKNLYEWNTKDGVPVCIFRPRKRNTYAVGMMIDWKQQTCRNK